MSEKRENKQLTIVNMAYESAVKAWSMPEQELKTIFGPDLTVNEFTVFLGMGRALGANPFLREIWAVKYNKSKPASIFLGRDFYRRKLQEQPNYIDHIVKPIFTNDDLEIGPDQKILKHNHNFKERGGLIGAYCCLICTDSQGKERHRTHIVYMEEYAQTKEVWANGQPTGQRVLTETWAGKPITMICKVAEAQCIRMYYQSLFAGTYDESEAWYEANKAKELAEEKFRDLPAMQNQQQITGAEQQAQYPGYEPVDTVQSGQTQMEIPAETVQAPVNPYITPAQTAPAPTVQPQAQTPPSASQTGDPTRDYLMGKIVEIKERFFPSSPVNDEKVNSSAAMAFRNKCLEVTGNPNLSIKASTNAEVETLLVRLEMALSNTAKPAPVANGIPGAGMPNDPYAKKF